MDETKKCMIEVARNKLSEVINSIYPWEDSNCRYDEYQKLCHICNILDDVLAEHE